MPEGFDDFDEFVAKYSIAPHELGDAFAAWLSGKGWNGDYERVVIMPCGHHRNESAPDKCAKTGCDGTAKP